MEGKERRKRILSYHSDIEPIGILYDTVKSVKREASYLVSKMFYQYSIEKLHIFEDVLKENLLYRFNDDTMDFNVSVYQDSTGLFRIVIETIFYFYDEDGEICHEVSVPDSVMILLPPHFFKYTFSNDEVLR